MIGLVLVSHSAKLAEGLAELVASVQSELPVKAAGGTDDGRLGTSVDRIYQAILSVDNPAGVLVLIDLGSALMSAEIAIEQLDEEQRARVVISDAPLVEGALLVSVNAGLDMSLEELVASAAEARDFPKGITSERALESNREDAPAEVGAQTYAD